MRLETLFFSVNQNKAKLFLSSFFSLPSTLPSPCYCLLFLNTFSARFGFFVRLNPTNSGTCTWESAILQLLPIWRMRQRETERERILMLDSSLTDNLHFSRTTTNQAPNSLDTKNFNIAFSFDFVIPQYYYELYMSKHIYSLTPHESSLKPE